MKKFMLDDGNLRWFHWWAGGLLLVGLGLLLSACTPSLAGFSIEDSFDLPTLTPLPTSTPLVPTAVPSGAAEVGQTFYKAWEVGDLVGMYSLLSPQSQALIDRDLFSRRYREALQAATVQGVHIQPLAAKQEGTTAVFDVQVTWQTALFGDLITTHTAPLAYQEDRWGIVWNESLILPDLLGGNRLQVDYRTPARANIYDKNGNALAYQGDAILLGVVPGEIQDEAGLLATISPLLNQSPEQLRQKYATADPNWYIPLGQILRPVMEENYAALEPYLSAGLTANPRLARLYNEVAPHMVGYVGRIPPAQLESYLSQGYNEESLVGLTGLEGWGERYLSGQRGGTLTVVDSTGRFIKTLAETEPRQARSIYTTFDIGFQQQVEQILAESVQNHPLAKAGTAVVLDVQTGDVLAMASYPTYDPNIFDSTRPNAQESIAALFNDPSRPLLNRVVQGEYPAGSVFKLITMIAATRSGLYTPNTAYTSTGTWDKLGPTAVKVDWREGGHGTVSLRGALTVSCNTCFYDAAYNMDLQDPNHFPAVAKELGFGSPTGIRGLNEAAGLVPDPQWKPANTAEGGWVTGDAVNLGIGQGYLLVTPLQIAELIAAIANNGTLIEPNLIDRIGAGGGAPEEVLPRGAQRPLPTDAATLQAIREALRAVAASDIGTANFVFDGFPIPVAGKTGTAQTAQPMPHAWFAGYAPAEPYTTADGRVITEPEIAVVVMLENAGEGSEVAAPIFRRIVAAYYGLE
jgi:penicillin-binding protein 2